MIQAKGSVTAHTHSGNKFILFEGTDYAACVACISGGKPDAEPTKVETTLCKVCGRPVISSDEPLMGLRHDGEVEGTYPYKYGHPAQRNIGPLVVMIMEVAK